MAQSPHPHPHHGGLSEADAEAAVTKAGYSNITNMVQHGHAWFCDATDSSGAAVKLIVDGHGGVHVETPDSAAAAPAPAAPSA